MNKKQTKMKKTIITIASSILVMAFILSSCDNETIYETVTEQIHDTLYLPQDTLYLPQDTVNITDPELLRQAAFEDAITNYVLSEYLNYLNVSVSMFSKIIAVINGSDDCYIKCLVSYEIINQNNRITTKRSIITYYVSYDFKNIKKTYEEQLSNIEEVEVMTPFIY